MKLVLNYLSIMLMVVVGSSCVTTGTVVEAKYPQAAVMECTTYCRSSGTLSYRNENTYFCECPTGETVVVSRTGTIYK
jgi:hypothetical protein